MPPEWIQRFWPALEETGGNQKAAAELIGVKYDTYKSHRKVHRDFRAEVDERVARIRDGIIAPLVEGQMPSFFEWRTRHCAYLAPDGSVKRAQNSWFQFDAMRAIEGSNRVVMVLPPGHIKTTLFGIEYPTWRIQQDRNFRCTIIRANEEEAEKNLTAIAQRLSDHDYYDWLNSRLKDQGEPLIEDPITAYGGTHGYMTGRGGKVSDRWSRGALTVSGRTSGEKEPTVQAKGMGSAIAGNRADLIILDDAQDPKKYDTEGDRHSRKMMEVFRRDILGRIYDHQKLVILGNRLGPGDFMGEVIKTFSDIWGEPIYYPAILNEEKHELLCPEVWTWEGLEAKRKEVGEDVWAFHWMQQEVVAFGSAFTREQLNGCLDYDRHMGEVPHEADHVVLGVDPALSGYCAMVVLGIASSSGTRYLVDYVNERGMRHWDEVVRRGIGLATKYGVDTIVVETNNTQGDVYERFRRECVKMGIRCVGYKTATAMGAKAEETDFDISSIAALADQRIFRLPYKDTQWENSRRRTEAFIEQFTMWRPRPPGRSSWHLVRDLVMATLFAESEARRYVRRARTRPEKERVSRAPKWARNRDGKWPWQQPSQRPWHDRQGLSDDEVRELRETV